MKYFSIFIFSFLSIGIFWWAILLLKFNDEIFILKSQLDPKQISAISLAQEKNSWMVIEEGLFLIIGLFFSIYFYYRSYNQQINNVISEKNSFIGMTHELRTPIQALFLILETVRSRNLSKDQIIMLADKALKETHQLSRLINGLIAIAKIESKIDIKFNLISLNDLLVDVIQRANEMHQNRELIYIKPKAEIEIYGNYDLLFSAFFNLVENALKYSSILNPVLIEYQTLDQNHCLSITDEGDGISDLHKKKIFNMFYRGEQEKKQSLTGAGIGLYIVKKVLDYHRAKISVYDNSPKGTIFRVIIPKISNF